MFAFINDTEIKPPHHADLGHHGHVLTTLIEHGKTVNVVGYHSKEDGRWTDEKWIKPSTRDEMLASFDGWSAPVRQIISLVDKPDVWALFDHLPASTYFRGGQICLLGDAAHASTPHHGAGAGMAIEDAMILSRLLAAIDSAPDLEAAFTAYDAVRRPRSQRLVASSRRVARVYDFEDEEVGTSLVGLKGYLERAWDWIWNEDLDAQLENAMRLLRESVGSAHSGAGTGTGTGTGTGKGTGNGTGTAPAPPYGAPPPTTTNRMNRSAK